MTALGLLEPWLANAHSRSAAPCLGPFFSIGPLREGAMNRSMSYAGVSVAVPCSHTAFADRVPISLAGTTNGAACRRPDGVRATR